MVHRGYFRVSNRTGDVRVCPDHSGVVSWLSKPSGCAGSIDGANGTLCREGLGGIYCRACSAELADDHFYHDAQRECLECGVSTSNGIWAVVVMIIFIASVLLVRRHAKGWLYAGVEKVMALTRRASASKLLASLMVTAKTLIGFYQVVSEVEAVFIMELPVTVVRIIKSFSWLDLSITDLIQLECRSLGGYLNQLRFTAAAPALLVLLLIIGALIREAFFEGKRGWELARGTTLRALPWVLFLTFLVVPDVTSLAFQAFRCECFGDESWLRSDYSLQCTSGGCNVEHRTSEYIHIRLAAWAVLWVYAMGIPCVYALLLRLSRRTIPDEEHAPLADALNFLHEDYRPSYYAWELSHLAHKLTTVGFASLILPGTLMQLVIVQLIMLAYLLLLIVLRPYRTAESGLLAVVEQISLLVFIVLCLIVKAEQLASLADGMTDEIHKRYFYDTELIANVMIGALGTAVTSAALVSIHQAAPIAMDAWHEAFASPLDVVVEKASSRGKRKESQTLAARVRARQKLRSVLDRKASTLCVPDILHASDADTNPVLLHHLAVANEKARVQRARQLADARSNREGSASSARPGRLEGALRKLKLELDEVVEEDTAESRARALQVQLKRHRGVQGLVWEDKAPEEVAEQRRRVREASRTVPLDDAEEQNQLRQLAAFRVRLQDRGWKGAEKITARTKWQLTRHMIAQGRAMEGVAEDEDEGMDPTRVGAAEPDHQHSHQEEPISTPQRMPADGFRLMRKSRLNQAGGGGCAGFMSTRTSKKGQAGSSEAGGSAARPGFMSMRKPKPSPAALSGSGSGSEPPQPPQPPQPQPPRPAIKSAEEKFRGSLREMSQHVDRNLGDGLVLSEAAAAAAERAIARRKRRASLTAGDDEWEDMIVKDRPRRETNTGLERDHTPLASVRGRGGVSERSGFRSKREGSTECSVQEGNAERSMREGSRSGRSMRERSLAERSAPRSAYTAERSKRSGRPGSSSSGPGGPSSASAVPEASGQPAPPDASDAGDFYAGSAGECFSTNGSYTQHESIVGVEEDDGAGITPLQHVDTTDSISA